MEKDLKKLIAFVVPYTMLCSVASNFFYWDCVHVNPFDFISLDGIITLTVPALIMSGFFIAPVWILGSLFPRNERLPTEKGEKNKLFKFVALISFAVVIGSLLSASTKAFLNPILYVAVACFQIPCGSVLSYSSMVSKQFSSRVAAFGLVLVLICLPEAMLWYYSQRASNILNGSEFTYIEATNLKDLGGLPLDAHLIYYGKLGNFLFFNVDKSILGFPMESFNRLEFKSHTKSSPTLEGSLPTNANP